MSAHKVLLAVMIYLRYAMQKTSIDAACTDDKFTTKRGYLYSIAITTLG